MILELVARVIINHDSKTLDKLFDYEVPKELTEVIGVGSRVTVPFGGANRPVEAYVMETAAHSAAKRLKSIIKYEDDVFDDDMCALIKWMREKYMCGFLDIIKAVIPSGISIKQREWIVVLKNDESEEIVRTLSENGGAMEINRLYAAFDEDISRRVKGLIGEGVLGREYREAGHVGDKLVRVASASVSAEELEEALKLLRASRAPAQYRILDILSMNDRISVADLVQFARTSYSAVRLLEKKGYIKTYDVAVTRARSKEAGVPKIPELTDEQARAERALADAMERGAYESVLIHGVTGSGKTEVYMRAIERALDSGKTAIMLVPEIALTAQMVARFTERFGNKIAVFHSGLSLGERYDEWKKLKCGEARVVVGARSAVFAPMKNIGIIIIDEAHEATYKSDMSPRYNTKEVAEFRARQNGAVLVLASATPEVGDYYAARCGRHELIELKKRVNMKKMPETEIVDMRGELEAGNRSVFSRRLCEEISKNLSAGEQTILFLNRRGYSTFVSCRSCGFVPKCPNCSISLTYHKYSELLKCHYCGYAEKNYRLCPKCGSKYIRYFGGGTQRIEEELKSIFPGISTIRMDVDTTVKINSHEQILKSFAEDKIDVLVGTQMVTKGLDFENVTLAGVISADVLLNVQDYRAGERTFDLLEQVTGRAGRAKKDGRAVIQTYSPESYAVLMAKEHDYLGFYEYETAMRSAMWYPPYCEMVSVLFSGASESATANCARLYAKHLQSLGTSGQKTHVLGPIPAAVAKINNKYRWRILIKCENSDRISGILSDAREACRKNMNYKEISVIIDKNPSNAY